jgi:hypothetical protein
MDPTWMLKSIVDQNPLVWMAKVDGPNIPADQE